MNFIPKLCEGGLFRNVVRSDAVNHDVVEIETTFGTNQPSATLNDLSFLNHDEAQGTGTSAIGISSFKIDGSPVHVFSPSA
jgi:hypothetical protein